MSISAIMPLFKEGDRVKRAEWPLLTGTVMKVYSANEYEHRIDVVCDDGRVCYSVTRGWSLVK